MKLLPRLFALFAMVLAAASPAAAEDITLKAADGTALHAEYNKVNGEGAVVLVHMLGRGAKDWRFVADKLNASGLSTIAVDLRKHGANLPQDSGRPELSPQDFAGMKQDVQAAVAHLKAKGRISSSRGASPVQEAHLQSKRRISSPTVASPSLPLIVLYDTMLL